MSKKVKIRPSKGASLLGFAVGIIFVFIGATLVIPTFGLFGIFWTIIAIAITCINGINAFSEKGISDREMIIDDTLDKVAGDYKSNAEQRLLELQDLYDKQLISKEEFEKKREDIVDSI